MAQWKITEEERASFPIATIMAASSLSQLLKNTHNPVDEAALSRTSVASVNDEGREFVSGIYYKGLMILKTQMTSYIKTKWEKKVGLNIRGRTTTRSCPWKSSSNYKRDVFVSCWKNVLTI